MHELERQTRHREVSSTFKAARFRQPAISRDASERLQKAYYNLPPLGLDQQGEAVKALQQALIDLKHPGIVIPDGATGYYGKQTKTAVTAFQRAAKLSGVDGVAGKQTLSRLDDIWFGNAPKLDDLLPPYDDDAVTYCPNHMMIPRLKQPNTSSCWATAASMVYYWRHPDAMAGAPPGGENMVKHVLRRAQDSQRWLDYYAQCQGLPTSENINFYSRGLGMQHAGSSPDSDYGMAFWTGKLVRSPLVLSSGRVVMELMELHAVVVIGLRRFASDNMPKVYVIDPWDGKDKEWTMVELIRRVGWLGDTLGDWSDWRKVIPSVSMQFRERIFYW